MSDTPRADAIVFIPMWKGAVVNADDYRELEREAAALRKSRDEWKAKADNCELDAAFWKERAEARGLSLHRAFVFIQDTDLHFEGQMQEKDTRRILRELHDALNGVRGAEKQS